MSTPSASLLLIAPQGDDHGDAVEQALRERDFRDYARLDASTEEWSIEQAWSAVHGASWSIAGLNGPCERTSAGDLRVVWLRRWMASRPYGDRGEEAPHSSWNPFDRSELGPALTGLVESLPSGYFPLGHPREQQCAGYKPAQLKIAHAAGLATPASLHSTNPESLAAFCQAREKVLVKPQFRADYRNAEGVLVPLRARTYEGARLAEAITQRDGPTQLFVQDFVAKNRDWRVTVFPGSAWCCEIDTSSLPPDEPDWRSGYTSHPHRMIPLEAEFEARLRDYLHRMGLASGYFDFALDPDGSPIFLECNTNAEWFWMEKLCGAPIAAALADDLVAALER